MTIWMEKRTEENGFGFSNAKIFSYICHKKKRIMPSIYNGQL